MKPARIPLSAKYLPLLRRLAAATALALPALCAAPASAESAFKPEDGFGVGIVLGSPSGLTASLPMAGGTRAVDAVLGYDLGRDAAFRAQADYVWIRGDLLDVERGKVSLYYGPGAFVVASAHSAIGIRIVGGVDYRFEGVPLQAFLEAGPGINVLPNTEVSGSGGLGLRYYF